MSTDFLANAVTLPKAFQRSREERELKLPWEIKLKLMQFQNWQMVKAPFASAEGWIATQLYYSKGSEDAEYKALIQRESIW